MIKLTQEIFLEKITNLYGNEYEILSQYLKNSIKVKIKHNKCNCAYETLPSNFLAGHGCPNCAINYRANLKRISDEEFKQEVYNLVGSEYVPLEEYKNSNQKILFKHNLCGNEYYATPSKFKNNRRCPKCSRIRITLLETKSTEKFKQEVFNLVKDEYKVLGEYINNHTKIKFKHNICGNEFEIQPKSFLHGHRCAKCSENNRIIKRTKTHEKFLIDLNNLFGNEYKILDIYKNAKTKILVKHNVETCGKNYLVKPNNLLNGKKCPFCKESKGEKQIEYFLINNNIKFEIQKTFNNCKHKNKLPFDFYLSDYNICIE